MICAVQYSLERKFASPFAQITSNNAAVPLIHEGRFAIVTDVERDAMDADGADDEGAGGGRRSRVVLTPRRWRQVGDDASHYTDDGDKKARSPERARRKPLKPLRGECRVIPV
jgi:hypothetical protein